MDEKLKFLAKALVFVTVYFIYVKAIYLVALLLFSVTTASVVATVTGIMTLAVMAYEYA